MENDSNAIGIDRQAELPEPLTLNASFKQASSLYPCPHCILSFGSHRELGYHINEKSIDMTKKEEKGIENQLDSSLDESEIESSGSMKYACEECQRSFISYRGLKQHNGKMHDLGKKPFACDYCGKKFKIKYALSTHMKTCNQIIRKYQNVKFR
ncbi:unnamed protein product [Blepharisma stoltei]|uniref:C2H2-type domain-containing protein n=1 Tax=Blepharisma stoltei TaxID=1481888 RepID=A0AAU9K8X4_9CILI|nr:unnamed protein product [Blepharisma stoltei]